jgi:hypothetical protein
MGNLVFDILVVIGGLFGGLVGFVVLLAAVVMLMAPYYLMYRRANQPDPYVNNE